MEMVIKCLIIIISMFILSNCDILCHKKRIKRSQFKYPYHGIQQKIDHFNEDDNRTWNMRYSSSSRYFRAGGPMILYVGGEDSIENDDTIFLTTDLLVEIAKEVRGHLFHTEHRFYGESQPFEDLSTENLKYLSIDQTLADLAHFITKMKEKYRKLRDAKVILTGCSYPGAIVTRFMQTYPELADGGWASGADILAKVDYEYIDVAGEAIRYVNENCYQKIKKAIIQAHEIMFNPKNTSRDIQNMFGFCGEYDIGNVRENFLISIQVLLGDIAQDFNYNQIKEVCNQVIESNSTEETLEIINKVGVNVNEEDSYSNEDNENNTEVNFQEDKNSTNNNNSNSSNESGLNNENKNDTSNSNESGENSSEEDQVQQTLKEYNEICYAKIKQMSLDFVKGVRNHKSEINKKFRKVLEDNTKLKSKIDYWKLFKIMSNVVAPVIENPSNNIDQMCDNITSEATSSSDILRILLDNYYQNNELELFMYNLKGQFFEHVNRKCYGKIYKIVKYVILIDDVESIIDHLYKDIYLKPDYLEHLIIVSRILESVIQENDFQNIKSTCEKISFAKSEPDIFKLLYKINKEMINQTEAAIGCESRLTLLKSTNVNNTERVWVYQQCTELGSFISLGPDKSFMRNPKLLVDLQLKSCYSLFGISKEQVYKNIEGINERFGGLNPYVPNVFFTNGALDPWKGLEKKFNNDGSSSIIPNISHCGEWESISENDSEPLRAMKIRIKKQIRDWITDPEEINETYYGIYYKLFIIGSVVGTLLLVSIVL